MCVCVCVCDCVHTCGHACVNEYEDKVKRKIGYKWNSLAIIVSLLLQVLEARSTLRVSRVVEEVFRRVALGIQNNEGFTPQALLVFIHNLISNSIPQLTQKPL